MDLNLIIGDVSQSRIDTDQVIRQKLERCLALGYHTVAVSVIMDASSSLQVPPLPKNIKNLCPSKLKVYTRLTVKVTETIQLYKVNKNKEIKNYDLLALQPLNDKILQYILMGSTELDILTFDLSARLDLKIFNKSFKLLEQRGVCVEVNYGPAQLGSSLRRAIICSGQNLVEKTVKNILLSSGIDDVFRLRSPKDAKSLGVLFMLPTSRCHDAVFNNGHKALNQSKHRKNPASSAIELVTED